MQENKGHLSNRRKKIQVNASNEHLSQLSVYHCLIVAFLPAVTNSIRSPAQFRLPQAVPLFPLFVFQEFYYFFCWKQRGVEKFEDLQAQMKKENDTCYMRSNYVDILFIIFIIFLPPNSPCSIKVLHVLVEQKCSCIWQHMVFSFLCCFLLLQHFLTLMYQNITKIRAILSTSALKNINKENETFCHFDVAAVCKRATLGMDRNSHKFNQHIYQPRKLFLTHQFDIPGKNFLENEFLSRIQKRPMSGHWAVYRLSSSWIVGVTSSPLQLIPATATPPGTWLHFAPELLPFNNSIAWFFIFVDETAAKLRT